MVKIYFPIFVQNWFILTSMKWLYKPGLRPTFSWTQWKYLISKCFSTITWLDSTQSNEATNSLSSLQMCTLRFIDAANRIQGFIAGKCKGSNWTCCLAQSSGFSSKTAPSVPLYWILVRRRWSKWRRKSYMVQWLRI